MGSKNLGGVYQNYPDVVDVGERRTGQQEIAGGRKERGGIVVGEIGRGSEAERLHLRKRGLIDHGAGRIGRAAGAAVGAVGVRGQRYDT